MQQEPSAEQIVNMDDILNKLTKVQALHDGATTPAEAEAAAAAMTRLLTKYNLDAVEIQQRLGNRAAPLLFAKETITNIGNAPWQRSLLHVIAQHNQCRAFYTVGTKDATLIGPAATLNVVRSLHAAMDRAVQRLITQAWRDVTFINVSGTTWRAAYALGCVSGINVALARATETAIAQTANGSALVLVQESALNEEVAKHIGKTRSGPRMKYDHDAYTRGYRDGLGVNVAQRGELS